MDKEVLCCFHTIRSQHLSASVAKGAGDTCFCFGTKREEYFHIYCLVLPSLWPCRTCSFSCPLLIQMPPIAPLGKQTPALHLAAHPPAICSSVLAEAAELQKYTTTAAPEPQCGRSDITGLSIMNEWMSVLCILELYHFSRTERSGPNPLWCSTNASSFTCNTEHGIGIGRLTFAGLGGGRASTGALRSLTRWAMCAVPSRTGTLNRSSRWSRCRGTRGGKNKTAEMTPCSGKQQLAVARQ